MEVINSENHIYMTPRNYYNYHTTATGDNLAASRFFLSGKSQRRATSKVLTRPKALRPSYEISRKNVVTKRGHNVAHSAPTAPLIGTSRTDRDLIQPRKVTKKNVVTYFRRPPEGTASQVIPERPDTRQSRNLIEQRRRAFYN